MDETPPITFSARYCLGSHFFLHNDSRLTCHTQKLHYPLSPTSDQHQFSPYNINRQSRGRVMRINKIITEEKKASIFYQILSTHSLRKCIEISLENLYVDIGA